MSKKAFIDTVRQVGMEGNPHLTVWRSPIGPGLVTIEAIEPTAKEWFGDCCLTMNSSLARKLAEALIACADESEVQS